MGWNPETRHAGVAKLRLSVGAAFSSCSSAEVGQGSWLRQHLASRSFAISAPGAALAVRAPSAEPTRFAGLRHDRQRNLRSDQAGWLHRSRASRSTSAASWRKLRRARGGPFDPASTLCSARARGFVGRRNVGRMCGWRTECRLLAVLCSLGAASCASSDPEQPSTVCDGFVTRYCEKAVSCAQETDRTDLWDLCDFSLQVYLPCERVKQVLRDAGQCESEVAAIRCTDVPAGSFPVSPESCQGLFGIE